MINPKSCKIQPSGTIIYKSIIIDAVVGNPFFSFIFLLVWLLGVASIVVAISVRIGSPIVGNNISVWSTLFMGVFLFYVAMRGFYLKQIRYPKKDNLKTLISSLESKECNIYAYFSFELAKAFNFHLGSGKGKNAKDLALAVASSPDIVFICSRIGISSKMLLEVLNNSKNSTPLNEVISRSLEIAYAENHHRIEVGDVFIALCEIDEILKQLISDLGLETQDLANVVYWQTQVVRRTIKNKNRFFDPDDLKLTGGIGRDWAYGMTPLLARFSRDITDQIARYGISLDVVGHNHEIKQIEEAMTRGMGGNVLVVGEPGVGKKTTVMGLVKKIYEGKAMGQLSNKRVIQIEIESLLSGAADQNDLTGRISEIFSEAARAGNVILFIENFQNIVTEIGVGTVDASEIVLNYAESSGLNFLGTTDTASFNRYISTNSMLMQKFAKVDITEPTRDEMVRILEDVIPQIEYHTNSLITYEAIKATIKAADRYILNIPNPEKSIDLLDGASAKATSERGETIITSSDILKYVSEKYDIPDSEVGDKEKEKLLNLESTMHERVIGQEEAINAIANAMRRSRAGVTETKKPIGSFLFLGTTGVGKTETAKALAEAYFGDENRMIRFDMSEFQNKQDIYRLIGSNVGGEETQGLLTTAVREKPFSLLLFDEVEKANPDILNLFLQILDEGRLTDGDGRKVSFTNSIIIATSNAGANMLRTSIQSGSEYEKTKTELLNYIQENNIYRPEFINRFTGVIIFSPLTQDNIREVAKLMIGKLQKDMAANKGVKVEVEPDAVDKLAILGYDMRMGARPMARTIQEKVENMLAKKLLSSELGKGDTIIITGRDIV